MRRELLIQNIKKIMSNSYKSGGAELKDFKKHLIPLNLNLRFMEKNIQSKTI